MKDKTLWIVGGANGSGKTSLVTKYSFKFKDRTRFINPDDIAKYFDPKYDGRNIALIQKAGRETILRQRKYFKEGRSFGYETTFSSKRYLKIISKAQEIGYEVKLIFIGLNAPALNISRVEERVRQGGHHVAPKDIIRRYERAINNLIESLDLADKVYIFDNSGTRIKMVCRIKNEKIVRQSKNLPRWIKDSEIIIKLKSLKSDIDEKKEIKSILEDENEKQTKKTKRVPPPRRFKP